MRPLSFYCSSCFKDPKETAYSQHNFYIGIRDQQNNNNNVEENREVMIRVPVFFFIFGKRLCVKMYEHKCLLSYSCNQRSLMHLLILISQF